MLQTRSLIILSSAPNSIADDLFNAPADDDLFGGGGDDSTADVIDEMDPSQAYAAIAAADARIQQLKAEPPKIAQWREEHNRMLQEKGKYVIIPLILCNIISSIFYSNSHPM